MSTAFGFPSGCHAAPSLDHPLSQVIVNVLREIDNSIRTEAAKQQNRGEAKVSPPSSDSLFAVALDVARYGAEELKIAVDDCILTVEGEHEETTRDGGYAKRSFIRKWVLPEGVDASSLRSNISDEGQLTIEAPRAIAARTVPITITTPSTNSKKE